MRTREAPVSEADRRSKRRTWLSPLFPVVFWACLDFSEASVLVFLEGDVMVVGGS